MKNGGWPMTDQPRRILVRGTNWLGDAVMTTPALLRLGEKFPAAHIALLCPEKLADLWRQHPAVHEVIPFAAGESVLAVGRKLRAGRFDLALVLPNSPRSALEVFLGGIPHRIGHARPWRNLFLTQAIPPRAEAVMMHKRTAAEIRALVAADVNRRTDRAVSSAATTSHQIHEYLHLAAALGAAAAPLAPQLAVTPGEIAAARQKFGLEKISAPVFGLNPGAEYGPAKRWPAERFIAAAREIQRRTGCRWLIFGGKADVELAERIAAGIQNPEPRIHSLAGKTSLRELMALLASCRVLLTNDTGPMHVAAALGTPVVVPFGSTSPELTGPVFSANAKVLKTDAPCSPCFLRECPVDFRCMNGIGVEQVVGAVMAAAGGAGV
jgi:heptosyltransferase-2